MVIHGKERWIRVANRTAGNDLRHRLKTEIVDETYDAGRYRARRKVEQFGAYVERFLTDAPVRGLKPSTISGYRIRLHKRILPAFGEMVLSRITRARIKEWTVSLLDERLDFDTVKGYVLTLSAVLSQAVEDGLLSANPALRSGMFLKRPKMLTNQRDAFSPEQETAILTATRELFTTQPMLYPLTLTLFRTGIRVGELLGLC
jgi:site-specific recombinase XerD